MLGVADPLHTLMFEGLWVLADRAGRLEDRPLRIKAEVFPYRNVDPEQHLQWLADNGFIRRYSVGVLNLIQIVNFDKHQNPHKNEGKSELPIENKVVIESQPKSEPVPNNSEALALIPDSLNLIPDSLPVRFKVESFDGQEAFEDLCKHYKRAERSVIASRRYFEAVEWVVEHKKIPRQEAAAYIRERAELYCSKCKFQKGLTRWLEEKIFEQDESAWSDLVNANGGTNGQNQRNGNASLGKQADRNEANRDAILAGIFGGNAGGNAASGGGAGEDDAHPGGIGHVGKAGTKLLT